MKRFMPHTLPTGIFPGLNGDALKKLQVDRLADFAEFIAEELAHLQEGLKETRLVVESHGAPRCCGP